MTHASDDGDDFREQHLRRRGDFLGAFGVLRREGRILFVENERTIGGVVQSTWDLPGGQVEPGELVAEALVRELSEEIDVEVLGEPRFLFVQEGEKRRGAHRQYAWRSFFFAVDAWRGEPRAASEVLDARWLEPAEVLARFEAPYHDSFAAWLRHGAPEPERAWYRSRWDEAT